jgi:hypothetical protein
MTLDPLKYECPEHQADLTPLVTEALDDDAPPVAFWGLRKKPAGPRPFQVIVTCPGSGGATAHQLTFAGNWAR